MVVFTILYGRWTGPRASQQGNLAIAEKTKGLELNVGISTDVKISGRAFLSLVLPKLNAERGISDFFISQFEEAFFWTETVFLFYSKKQDICPQIVWTRKVL